MLAAQPLHTSEIGVAGVGKLFNERRNEPRKIDFSEARFRGVACRQFRKHDGVRVNATLGEGGFKAILRERRISESRPLAVQRHHRRREGCVGRHIGIPAAYK